MTGQMDGLLDFAFFWSSPFLPTIVRLQPGLRSFYNGIRGRCIISPIIISIIEQVIDEIINTHSIRKVENIFGPRFFAVVLV